MLMLMLPKNWNAGSRAAPWLGSAGEGIALGWASLQGIAADLSSLPIIYNSQFLHGISECPCLGTGYSQLGPPKLYASMV